MTSKRRQRRRAWLKFSENNIAFGCRVSPSNPNDRDFLRYAWAMRRRGQAELDWQDTGVQRWVIGRGRTTIMALVSNWGSRMPMQEAIASVEATRKALVRP